MLQAQIIHPVIRAGCYMATLYLVRVVSGQLQLLDNWEEMWVISKCPATSLQPLQYIPLVSCWTVVHINGHTCVLVQYTHTHTHSSVLDLFIKPLKWTTSRDSSRLSSLISSLMGEKSSWMMTLQLGFLHFGPLHEPACSRMHVSKFIVWLI